MEPASAAQLIPALQKLIQHLHGAGWLTAHRIVSQVHCTQYIRIVVLDTIVDLLLYVSIPDLL